MLTYEYNNILNNFGMDCRDFLGSFSNENAPKCDNPEDSSEMKRAENEMMQIA